ncbi:ubiquinol-cytochrome c reductase iron-sulfur subunit [Streptomyces sp. NPDC058662]|uniref:QcrA and Rieske domain-containing protein n=1 Tax=Streptomyces sp. NPDC058662 TaxID=3346583 RepID=UPI00365BACB8
MNDSIRTARRTVLTAGAAALAGGALTACGGGDGAKPESEAGSAASSSSPPSPTAATAAPVKALAKAADVPVGGGTVLKEEKLVITQPTAGNYRCFSAVCTHTGCLVNKVENGSIDCPCHGSKFKDTDGAVEKGPATRALAEKKIKVTDGTISLA